MTVDFEIFIEWRLRKEFSEARSYNVCMNVVNILKLGYSFYWMLWDFYLFFSSLKLRY